MQRIFLSVSIIFFSLLVFSACQPESSNELDENAMGELPVIEESLIGLDQGEDSQQTEGGQTVAIVMTDYAYDIKVITAVQGQPMTVLVTNERGTHDFVIDELNVDTGLIPVGETIEIEIPTDQVGEFEYYCSVNRHRELGMFGKLIIVEAEEEASQL